METSLPALPDRELLLIDGVSIATYLLEPEGAASRGDVVICHGTPWSARIWAGLASYLSRNYRVLLWDMPGYGRSTMDSAVSVDLASQMRRLATLVEVWRLDRPHVVAHDIGGAVALGAHLLHGSAFRSLHFWDIVTLDPWGSPFFRLVAEHPEVFVQLPEALHAALVREYISGAAAKRLLPAWLEALAEPWLGQVGQPAFYRQIAALSAEHTRPVAERLAEVGCPVRIGWGRQDPWIPLDQAYRLQGLLPRGVDVVEVPDAGHLVPIEAPQEVERAVANWLLGGASRAS
ncbi:alpha/beta fold hydrolase [Flexivirga meconopsidis]|uniref:alpha/beta fold hydrolase n=1 Tax=Flexivirga meconopsidis TaxID=2977121 RepID=UPI002240BF33|nr:alpha/beta hydrolase [Flexivirga meconopsidis]